MLYVFAALSAASALLCLLAVIFSSATLLGKVLLGLIFCGAVGALIASVEKIVSLKRDEVAETPDFEKPVSIQPPQAPFAGNAFSNDYKTNAPAPVAQENPWKFVPPYQPIPSNAPPFPAPIQNPAPHSTPSHYVPQQQPIQTVTPSSPGNGVGAALGGLALGTLLGAHLGSSATTAHAAAADEERRRRNNQTVTSPSSSEPAYVPPAALAPITAAEAEAQASNEPLKGVEDFQVVADEPAAGVALAPITADEAEAQTTETAPFDPFDRLHDHLEGRDTLAPITAEEAEAAAPVEQERETYQSPVTEPYRYEPEPEPTQSGVALEPITADEAERSTPSYSAPVYSAPEPAPTRYEPEPRYEAPSYTRDPDPEPTRYDPPSYDSSPSWSD